MKLIEALVPESINPSLRSRTKDELFGEMVALLKRNPKLESVDESTILKALKEREKTATTGVGKEVGIPHGKIMGLSGIVGAIGTDLETAQALCGGKPLDGLGRHLDSNRTLAALAGCRDPFDHSVGDRRIGPEPGGAAQRIPVLVGAPVHALDATEHLVRRAQRVPRRCIRLGCRSHVGSRTRGNVGHGRQRLLRQYPISLRLRCFVFSCIGGNRRGC